MRSSAALMAAVDGVLVIMRSVFWERGPCERACDALFSRECLI